MRVLIIIPFFLMSIANAQLPVTDGAANAQLALINKNLVAINTQLSTLNATMSTISGLMSQNVAATTGTLNFATQDNVSKRKSPTFLLGSPEMTELLDLKDNITRAYRETTNNMQSYQHLNSDEIQQAGETLAAAITKTSVLVAQATHVSSSPEMIEPGLRLSTITKIVEKMNAVLADVNEVNRTLKQKNSYRASINSLINTN